jgi:hypothetical protein
VRRLGKSTPSAARSNARARIARLARSRERRPAAVKLLRTIRLDPSDTFVFEHGPSPANGRSRARSRSKTPIRMRLRRRGPPLQWIFGLPSLGWSTLVQIVEASEADRVAQSRPREKAARQPRGARSRRGARAAEEEVALQPRSAIILRTR